MVVLSVGCGNSARDRRTCKTAGNRCERAQLRRNRRLYSGQRLRARECTSAGCSRDPKTFLHSVMEASAAACAAAIDLAPARGSLVKVKEIPAEKDISEETPEDRRLCLQLRHKHRLGRGRKGSYASTPQLFRMWSTATDYLFTCSQDSQEKAKEIIKENRLNRVVVAACSPRTHEPLFQETLQGLRPEQIPLRDGQYPRPGFLGPPEGAGSCHRKGQRPGSDGGGPGLAS